MTTISRKRFDMDMSLFPECLLQKVMKRLHESKEKTVGDIMLDIAHEDMAKIRGSDEEINPEKDEVVLYKVDSCKRHPKKVRYFLSQKDAFAYDSDAEVGEVVVKKTSKRREWAKANSKAIRKSNA